MDKNEFKYLKAVSGKIYEMYLDTHFVNENEYFYVMKVGFENIALDSLLIEEVRDKKTNTGGYFFKDMDCVGDFFNFFDLKDLGSIKNRDFFVLFDAQNSCVMLFDIQEKSFKPFFFKGYGINDLRVFYNNNKTEQLPKAMEEYFETLDCQDILDSSIGDGCIRKIKV